MRVITDTTTGTFLAKPINRLEDALIRRTEGHTWVHGVGWTLPISRRTQRILDVRDAEVAAYLMPSAQPALSHYGVRIPYDPYQRDGIQWLNARSHALLFDPPGTGKTLHAIAWAYDAPSTLVVCPKPVIDQWVAECGVTEVRWGLHVLDRYGKKWNAIGNSSSGGWYITNFEAMPKLPEVRWDSVVVDESTYIRNQKAQRTKNVLAQASRSNRVLALSGTPLVNRPLDLWSTMVLLRKRTPEQFWGFIMRYTGAYKTPYGWDMSGATHLDELAEDIGHWALRRERPPGLPPLTRTSVEFKLKVDDADRLSKLDATVQDAIRRGVRISSGMADMQTLRLDSAMSKLPSVVAWITNHLDTGGGQVLVFSNFKEPLRQMATLLGEKFTAYHGDLNDVERAENKRAFKAGERKVMGMTYAVGAMSHNLQEATTVVLLDPPWTPMEMEQAEDRSWRSGQTQPVQVIICLSGHPIESRIFYALENKQEIVSALQSLSQ